MANLPDLLAGSENLGSWAPVQIFSGEADIVTDGLLVATAFPIYSVIALNAAGNAVPHNPAAADVGGVAAPETRAIGIAAQAGVVGSNCPYYCGGVFNPDALVWNAATTTVAARKAVFARTNIQISTLY